MTKTAINPAPAATSPTVYDWWLTGETFNVWIDGEEAPRQINFPDTFQPSGCIEVKDGSFLMEETYNEGTDYERTDTFLLSFDDHLDQALTEDFVLWKMGLVAKWTVRAFRPVQGRHGFQKQIHVCYAATKEEAAAICAEVFGKDNPLNLGAPSLAKEIGITK